MALRPLGTMARLLHRFAALSTDPAHEPQRGAMGGGTRRVVLENTAATLNTSRDSGGDSEAAFRVREDALGLLTTVGLIVLIFFLCFGKLLFFSDDATFVGLGDTNTLNGPKAYFLDVRLKQGEFPLWDPL